MKRLIAILTLFICVFLTGCGTTKQLAKSDTGKFMYEIEGVRNGGQGSYLVKVWTYSNSQYADIENCKRNAVHGVIFKGYAGSGQVRPQSPLVRDSGAEITYADYFNTFFSKGGEYNKYVTVTSGSQEIVKVGKQYKIGLIVSVAKDMLRKRLEEVGVVKSLSYGF